MKLNETKKERNKKMKKKILAALTAGILTTGLLTGNVFAADTDVASPSDWSLIEYSSSSAATCGCGFGLPVIFDKIKQAQKVKYAVVLSF